LCATAVSEGNMPTTAELVAYCDQRTRRSAFADAPAAHNGLQMDNSGKVTRIGAAVDAGLMRDSSRFRRPPLRASIS